MPRAVPHPRLHSPGPPLLFACLQQAQTAAAAAPAPDTLVKPYGPAHWGPLQWAGALAYFLLFLLFIWAIYRLARPTEPSELPTEDPPPDT